MNAMTSTDAPALDISGLRKSFGKAEIIRGIDLSIGKGERHAVIGPNGAGKSTLFNLITARFAPTSGTVKLHGKDLAGLQPFQINRMGLSRSFQITNIFPAMSVFENVRCALLWSHGYKYSFWNMVGRSRDLTEGADRILEQINLTSRRDLPAGVLSYAEQRALEIGITIAGGADVIMLDEPTAGMSHSETDYIMDLIRTVTVGKTLIMVEHDMGVVFGLADRISVLVYGEIIATGKPEEVRGDARVQEAYLGAALEAEH
ncbi:MULTISPECIES: ABC transporter ATP-binding protein [unclassified Sulfitobacter]|jgi:branched-chain amino acid transport system ATP-binding protein|uniref:ABC transporter ATP-binding protein n=2 Tax=Sulfitobacter TaxID=60136 RepID=UPI0007C271BE|nr:ABC transporter ATP-binding protein [Sulfitobacter sp. HI0023]KZY26727.1 ABC transporter ATP-binding protein [Sulfitobacter sp. HI0040]KZZ63315.1 ABC transporter ATP-binding protein [Sulfitobacter sp. HI0129]MBO28995.1 ABC transporter ATP-binding protein [Paracoccaceae bacterium]